MPCIQGTHYKYRHIEMKSKWTEKNIYIMLAIMKRKG